MKTFNDFIDLCCEQIPWPEADVRRLLAAHLINVKLTERDVVIYINYPEYTEPELATAFGVAQSTISRSLDAVRTAWPTLLSDPEITRRERQDHLPRATTYKPWMDAMIRAKF